MRKSWLNKIKGNEVTFYSLLNQCKMNEYYKYDFIDHVTDAYTQKTYQSLILKFFGLNKSGYESVNSAIFVRFCFC